MNTESELKHCIACCEALPAKSSLCAKCGSFQKAWKNSLRYYSTIVGLITLVITAVVYVASSGMWKLLTWKDRIQILHLRYPGEIVLANIGDGDVFVRQFFWSGKLKNKVEEMTSNGSIEINTKVSVQQVIETAKLGLDVTHLAEYRTIRSDEVTEDARLRIFKEVRSKTNDCYSLVIRLDKPVNVLAAESDTGIKFWSIPLEAILYFYSIHYDKILEQKFPVIGLVLKRTDSKCEK